MKMIYLASPYTHEDINIQELRYHIITDIAARLTERTKNCFFLPITQSYHLSKANPKLGGSFEAWKEIDLYAISKCDELWVVKLDGWTNSIGVQAEIQFAKDNKIPVKYLNKDGE